MEGGHGQGGTPAVGEGEEEENHGVFRELLVYLGVSVGLRMMR